MPRMDWAQTLTIIAAVAGLVWASNRQTNKRIDDMRSHFDARIDDLRGDLRAHVDTRVDDLHAQTAENVKALRADMNHRSDSTDRQLSDLRADMNRRSDSTDRQLSDLRADLRAVIPRAAAEPATRT